MNVVDLYSGAGGFSTGARWAGMSVIAAYDVDPILTSSYVLNFPKTKLCLGDLSEASGAGIKRDVDCTIDGIYGGPPCQGFSNIGKRDIDDPRRLLLAHFFRLVSEIRPKFFVMENVMGLAQGEAREVLNSAIEFVADRYTIVGPFVLDASDYGAATKRRRVFVLGFDPLECDPISLNDIKRFKASTVTVHDAIADLNDAVFQAHDKDGFDNWRLRSVRTPSDYANKLRSQDFSFTGHKLTQHTQRVVDRFSQVEQGDTDSVGRHPRLSWGGQCPTLRAGTGSDKGSYQSVRPIHPKYSRVITVREAARLQGFPDSHKFHPTIWHSFRMIGNSVSPFVAKAIFDAIGSKVSLPLSSGPAPMFDAAE